MSGIDYAGLAPIARAVIGGTNSPNYDNYRYTAVTGDTVSKVWIYGNSGNGLGTVDVAVYTYSSGAANRVGVQTVNITSVTTQWYSAIIASPWSLSNGTAYCVAWGNPQGNGGSINIYNDPGTSGNQRDTSADGLLSATWNHSAFDAVSYAVYAEVSQPATTSIPVIMHHLRQQNIS